jgi:hypothetical protein
VGEAAGGWADRVDVILGNVGDLEAYALLIRPDGYVAWATDTFGADDGATLRTALTRWFGNP